MIIPINHNIKYYRQMKRMTQQQLADKIGVAHTVVQRYESGAIAVPYERILQLAEALDISPITLMGLDNMSNRSESLIESFSKLSEDNKQTVERLVQALLVSQIANSK